MIPWSVVAGGLAVASGAAVVLCRSREDALVRRRLEALDAAPPPPAPIAADELATLPPPVACYLRRVLPDNQATIRRVTMRQSGVLRTSPSTDRWLSFTARQVVVPPAPGFVWDARVAMPLGTHVRVVDSYVDGVGAGRVSLLSALRMAAESGAPELTSGALHRYLAEAVWYPTALLPQAGVAWSPIDDRTALATLTDRGTTVSLEFRFDPSGDVAAIYSPGRYGRFGGAYRQVPWEGHFADYEERAGLRVPRRGEVGWYVDGSLELVWKGEVVAVDYDVDFDEPV